MAEDFTFTDTDQAPDGAALLDAVEAFLRRFVAFPSDHAAVAAALWAAHTHLAATFDSTPRLALLSPEKQSGKSRTLELLELLCAGAEFLSDASPSFIFRRIGAGEVTVLLDECDAIWKGKDSDESKEALRSIVNAGHRKRATVGRVEMNGKTAELARFPVYAPVALAGIGNLPDTILDRSVIIPMRRRAPDEHVEPYRERTGAAAGEELRDRLGEWAEAVADKVGCPWPEMPADVVDRPADVWEPLLAVAELAAGQWPERARAACQAFVSGSRDATLSSGVQLLADIREAFGDADVLATATLLDRLHAIEESPWATMYGGKGLDARGLAKKLREHHIKSRQVRVGERTVKGYRRIDFHDAWARYLPTPTETSETGETPLASPVSLVSPVSHQGETPEPRPCQGCGDPIPAASGNEWAARRHIGCHPAESAPPRWDWDS